jgi:hypothetical protein
MPEIRCYFCTSFVDNVTIEGINGNWDARYNWYRNSGQTLAGYTDVVGSTTVTTTNQGLENYVSSGNNGFADSTTRGLSVTAPTITGYKSTYTLKRVAVFWFRSPWDLEDNAIGTDGNYSTIDANLRIYPSGNPLTSSMWNGKLGRQFTNGETITYYLNYSWRFDLIFLSTHVATVVTIIYYQNTSDSIGGTVPSRTDTSYPNQYTISGATRITRTGYTNQGWITDASVTYTTDTTLNHPASDSLINLHAIWLAKVVTVIYYQNTTDSIGGTVPSRTDTSYPNQYTISGATRITRTGYTNQGWITDASATFTINTTLNHPASDSLINLYAIWLGNLYKFKYNSNVPLGTTIGGTIPSDTSARYPNNVPVTGNTSSITRTGYILIGWNTNSGVSTYTYNSNTSIPHPGTEIETILYAIWNIITYNINYYENAGGATEQVNSNTYNDGTNVTIKQSNLFLTPTGKVFVRWYTTRIGTGGTAYIPGQTFTIVQNINLYALWGYTVTFNLNGGSGTTPSSISDIVNTSITLPSVLGIVKTGYTAIGWNTTSSATTALTSYSMQTSNTILYVVWNLDPYPIYHLSFSAKDGIVDNKYVKNILSKAIITTNSSRSCLELVNGLTTTVTMDATNINSYKYCTVSTWFKTNVFQKNSNIIYEYNCVSTTAGLTFKIYYTAGVNRYFNDNVTWFIEQTPSHTGTTTDGTNEATLTANIIPTNDSWEYYSIEWFGYFLPNETGDWTFWTVSDDASYLWIGDNAKVGYSINNATVNNGGLHGNQERSGTANLTSGVYYPIRVQFGENAGGDNMTISFKSPSGTRTYNGSGYWFVNNNFQMCTEGSNIYNMLTFKVNNNIIYNQVLSGSWTYVAWNYRTYASEQHFIRINSNKVYTYTAVNLSPSIASHYLGHINNPNTIYINDYRIICEENPISDILLNQIYNLDLSYTSYILNNTSYTTPAIPNTKLGYNFMTWSDGTTNLNASTVYNFTYTDNKIFKAIWDDKYLGKIFDTIIVNGGNNYAGATTLSSSGTNTSVHPTITVSGVTKTAISMGNNAFMFAFDDNNPSGTMNFTQDTVCDILLVGGGGGTPTDHGIADRYFGGGGSGGIVFIKSVTLNGNFTFTRGNGGTHANYWNVVPSNGGDSIIKNGNIDVLRASGGGAGIGANGGSGGGGGLVYIQATAGKITGGSNLTINSRYVYNGITGNIYGNKGGNGQINIPSIYGGGGGGAGKIGGSNYISGELTADGGDGICDANINGIRYKFIDLYGKFYGVDNDYDWNTYFGGGGAGSGGGYVYNMVMPTASKKGGKGGGGNGAIYQNTRGVNGLPNTGGGGGGSGTWYPAVVDGAYGGSGIIIVRYYINQLPIYIPTITNGVIRNIAINKIGNGYSTTSPTITLNNIGSGSGASIQPVIGNDSTLSATDIKNRFTPTATGPISISSFYSYLGLTPGTSLSLRSLKGK